MGIRGELYSTKIALDNRTYFFNLKENRLGDLYLNIVESKNKDEGGFDRQSIVLFAEDLQNFLKGFDESLQVMEKEMRDRKRVSKGAPSTRRRAESPAPREDRAEQGTETDEDGTTPRSERKVAPWDRSNRLARAEHREPKETNEETSGKGFPKSEDSPHEGSRMEGRPGGFDRPFGDKPRSTKSYGERSFSDKPQGDRGYDSGRPQGERPYNDSPRGERPQSDRPFGGRPRNDRPQGDRPYGDKPQGDHSHRPSSGFHRNEGANRNGSTREAGDRGFQGRTEGRAPGYPFKREGETAPRTGSQYHGRPAGAPGDTSRPDHAGHSGHAGRFGNSPRPFSHAGDDSGFRKKFITGSKKSAGAFGLNKAVRKSRVVRAIPRKDVPED